MDSFYDFNDDFDGTAGSFRQPAMQQPNDSSGPASASLASAPSAVSSAMMVRRNKFYVANDGEKFMLM